MEISTCSSIVQFGSCHEPPFLLLLRDHLFPSKFDPVELPRRLGGMMDWRAFVRSPKNSNRGPLRVWHRRGIGGRAGEPVRVLRDDHRNEGRRAAVAQRGRRTARISECPAASVAGRRFEIRPDFGQQNDRHENRDGVVSSAIPESRLE